MVKPPYPPPNKHENNAPKGTYQYITFRQFRHLSIPPFLAGEDLLLYQDLGLKETMVQYPQKPTQIQKLSYG